MGEKARGVDKELKRATRLKVLVSDGIASDFDFL